VPKKEKIRKEKDEWGEWHVKETSRGTIRVLANPSEKFKKEKGDTGTTVTLDK